MYLYTKEQRMVTQVEPVTRLQRDHTAVLAQLPKGPVILSSRGKAAAVLLSVDDYDRMRHQIAMYERQATGDLAKQVDDWLDDSEVTAAFTTAGIAL
jgi:prevent-host-death family protein